MPRRSTGSSRFEGIVGLSFFSSYLGGCFLSVTGTVDCGLMDLRRGVLRLDCILALDRPTPPTGSASSSVSASSSPGSSTTDWLTRVSASSSPGSCGSDSAATSAAASCASPALSTAASWTSGAASCASTASSPSTAPTPPTDSASSSVSASSSPGSCGSGLLGGYFGGGFLRLTGTLECRLMDLRRGFLRLDCILTLDRTYATDRSHSGALLSAPRPRLLRSDSSSVFGLSS